MIYRIYALCDPCREGQVRYIGVTSKTLQKRLATHLKDARRGLDYRVYRWMRKVIAEGKQPEIRLIEETDDRLRECYWIACYAGPDLCNSTAGGDGAISPSPEMRAKISAANKGRKPSAYCIERARAVLIGHVKSPETLAKLAAANKCRILPPMTAEQRARQSAGQRGKKASAETRAKQSAARRGRKNKPMSAQGRANCGANFKGRKHSDETRAKMSATKKGRPKSEAHRLAAMAANPNYLPAEKVREARRLRAEFQWSAPVIAKHLNVGVHVIYPLLAGKTYRHIV